MSQSRHARAPPAKRPVPIDPCMRTIGCSIGRDSFGSNEELWQLFVRVGLFSAVPLCKHCQQPLDIEAARKRLHFSLMCWRCRQATNIITNTPLFQVSNIRKFLAALEGWCNDDKASSIISKLGITKRTWRSYKQIFNNVVWETLRRAKASNDLVLGRDGVVVEVDECHLHGRKYNRGRPLATSALWVVGIIERDNNGPRRSAFLLTRQRGGDVLVPFIREHVAPGSILVSDEWRGYTRELDQDYTRLTINHSVQFGNTITINGQLFSINTNHIEREWVEIRKIVKNIPEDAYDAKLNKEMFRLMYFNHHPLEERPFIFLEKLAATMH